MEEIIFVVARQLQSTLLLLRCVVIHLVFWVLRGGRTSLLVASLAYGGPTFLTEWRNWWVTSGGITLLLFSFLLWRLLLRLGWFLGLLGENVLLQFHLKLRGSRGGFGLLKLLLKLKKLLVDLTATGISICLLGRQSTPCSRGALACRKRRLKRVRSGRHTLRSYLLLFLILLHQKSLVQLLQLVYVIGIAHLHHLGACLLMLKTILRGLRWILG